jgi:uncharacterized protein YgbK (DUF1537 family)
MNPPQLLILADDLTGAADTAGYFARAGFRTLVRFAPGKGESAEVLALSTHSRHLSPKAAAQAQRRALAELGEVAPWVYKKIDSTLRGHPADELWAIMEALGLDRVLVAPAFPEQGRTTVGGRQRVEGRPLEQTSFGGDSDLLRLFSSLDCPVRYLDLSAVRGEGLAPRFGEAGLYVADAERDEDLCCLARVSVETRMRLWCGSAGLARALRAHLAPGTGSGPSLPERARGPALVVAGSRHSATLRQVERLGEEGALVAGLEATERAARALAAGQEVVLSTAALEPGNPDKVAQGLGRAARGLVERAKVGGLVLTGGDTALAVCAALESTGLWLRGEVEPGIPWGLLAGGPWAGLRVATKAGGFGGEGSLAQAVAYLKDILP